jgi:hypothetical protein
MKMHEKKLKKFKVYKIIANVLFYLVLIAGALGILVALSGVIILMANDINLADGLRNVLAMLDINIPLPIGNIPYALPFVVIAAIGVGIALSAYLFKTTSRLFGNIVATQTPFHVGTIRRLKNMGIALFIYTGLEALLGAAMGTLTSTILTDPSMSANVSIDFASVFFGLLLFALAEIFEYGASLQKDSESII